MQPFYFLNISRFLTALFLFILPFSTKILIYDQGSYHFGFFLENAASWLWVSEIFFLTALFFLSIHAFLHPEEYKKNQPAPVANQKYIKIFWLLIFALALTSIIWSPEKIVSFLTALRIAEMIVLFYLTRNINFLTAKTIAHILIAGAILQAIIAIGQYGLGHSLGLSFLGEIPANASTLGIARIEIGTLKILRSAGTFSHANILGGWLSINLLLLFIFPPKQKSILAISAGILIAGLIFSFSRSAWLGLIIGGSFLLFAHAPAKLKTLFHWENKTLTPKLAGALTILLVSLFALTFFWENIAVRLKDTKSISVRAEQNENAIKILMKYPFGVGAGTSVFALPEVSKTRLAPWEFQPVHNFFLLASNDLGFLGAILWIGLFFTFAKIFWEQKNFSALALLLNIFTIMNFDHYFYDIYSTQMLLATVLGIFFISTSNR